MQEGSRFACSLWQEAREKRLLQDGGRCACSLWLRKQEQRGEAADAGGYVSRRVGADLVVYLLHGVSGGEGGAEDAPIRGDGYHQVRER